VSIHDPNNITPTPNKAPKPQQKTPTPTNMPLAEFGSFLEKKKKKKKKKN
jgi:hypothetical protein